MRPTKGSLEIGKYKDCHRGCQRQCDSKAPGRTKITVTSSENSSYQASCTVTVPYKITYKLNKGKNNASNPSTYYGKKVTLKNPSRKGYAFAGWYTDAKFKRRSQVSAAAQNPITFCMQSGQK